MGYRRRLESIQRILRSRFRLLSHKFRQGSDTWTRCSSRDCALRRVKPLRRSFSWRPGYMANGFGFTPLQMAMVGPHVFGRILSRCAIRCPPSFRLSHVLPRLLTVARDKRRWAVRQTSSETTGQSPRCSHACWLNCWAADEHSWLERMTSADARQLFRLRLVAKSQHREDGARFGARDGDGRTVQPDLQRSQNPQLHRRKSTHVDHRRCGNSMPSQDRVKARRPQPRRESATSDGATRETCSSTHFRGETSA